MFYSPFDLVYKVSKILPVKIVLCILKETQRAYKIHHGVAYAAKLYPNAYLIHAIVGTSKGAGSGIIRVFEQVRTLMNKTCRNGLCLNERSML